MYICPQQIESLQNSLNQLQDAIVLKTSDKVLEDREQAISEIQYYKSVISNFFDLNPGDQAELIVQLSIVVEELGIWLEKE